MVCGSLVAVWWSCGGRLVMVAGGGALSGDSVSCGGVVCGVWW